MEQHSNVRYEVELLKLVLDKTKKKFGDYSLTPRTVDYTTHSRQIAFLQSNKYENYIATLGFDKDLYKKHELALIEFPIYLGLLGYRTCFVSEKIKNKVAKITTKNELLQFSQGSGIGWIDAEVLRQWYSGS